MNRCDITGCDREALVVHDIGRCGWTLCPWHARINDRICGGCGALWTEGAKV